MKQNVQIWLILLVMAFTFVVNNGYLDANIMESRNLVTAREMLEKCNWLKPTMNGELRLEKPPLPTWISAVVMYYSGQDNMALLRLPAALAGMLMIFFLFKLTGEITDDKEIPFIAAGTAATSFYIFFMARDISWDIFCHSFMLGAIWLIHKALNSETRCRKEFIWAGLLMGLSFLSKGPVSFYALLLPYLIARIIFSGWSDFAAKRSELMIMVIITIVCAGWWPVYIYFTNPEYSVFVALKESDAWLNRSTRPFYHYWSFPVQSGIWTIIATTALVFTYAKNRIDRFGNYWFLAGWVWIDVILLSLLPEKKERYLLPVLIPLSLLTAFYVRYLIDSFIKSYNTRADTILFSVNGILMSLISVAIPLTVLLVLKDKGAPENLYFIILFITYLSLGVLFIRALIKRNPFMVWKGMVGLVMFSCLLLLPVIPKIIQNNPDYRSYKELRGRTDLKNMPFYFNGEIPGKFIEVVWNCGHEIKKWDPMAYKIPPSVPPLVFISHEQPFLILDHDILARYDVELIGRFDGNTEVKRSNVVLANYVTIIRQRNNK
jgi:hypothetical protein